MDLITGGRLLIADDNDDLTESLAMIIRMWGHEVMIARDGEQALDKIITSQPHCAVLDLSMPCMNGFEVASRVRKIGLSSQIIRLIALTAHGYKMSQRKALDAGFDLFLVKPVDSESLRMAIERGVERRSRGPFTK